MGLFGFAKKQLLKVIECKEMNENTILCKYNLKDREEIMNSSTVIVRPAQVAVFVHKGEICDIFGAGTYKLASENIPFLTKILSLPTGFDSPIKAEVYFINMKQFTGLKWGTQNPIMMRDADFGNIRLRGFGIYSFKVDDPRKFMTEMSGVVNSYSVSNVAEQMKPTIVSAITDAIAESEISALDLAKSYKEFAQTVLEHGKKDFENFGLELSSLVIENLSLPEEVEKALDERTKLGVIEDKMGTYTQYQAAQALRDAAQNQSGGNFAAMGVGLGAGASIGGVFGNALATENTPKQTATSVCDKCGAKIKKAAKFCPECGQKQGFSCPKCNAIIDKNAKFCPECGASTKKVCEKCGEQLGNGLKFCPNCGNKING